MMNSCQVPIPPSVNTLYRNVAGRGRVKTKAYRAWIKAAQWIVHTGIEKVEGPVAVELAFTRGRYGMSLASDVSNRIKAAEDLLVTLNKIDGDTIKTVRRVSAEVTFAQDAEDSTCVLTVTPLDPTTTERSRQEQREGGGDHD